ncbi:MAG: hypothetical protein LBB12_03270 [Holosporaceae bacterium]|jgi:hypothetical protein|nr:hypothetical protein [Holosporaceae bacterium]
MKKFLFCLSSFLFLSFICAELDAFSLFKKKTSEDEEVQDETASMNAFGKKDISADIKAVDAMKTTFDNAKSKFASADAAIMKYSIDQKVFSEKSEVAFLTILSSVLALEARCFDAVSRGFSLIKDGMSNIKSSGKNVGGKNDVAGKKAFKQGVKLLGAIPIYRMMLNSIMSIVIQYAANIKATNGSKLSTSKIFKTIHAKDVEKQLETLGALHTTKKKLIGTQKGMNVALDDCRTFIDSAKDGPDADVAADLATLERYMQDITIIEDKINQFVYIISQAIVENKKFAERVGELANFNQECNADNATLSNGGSGKVPMSQSMQNNSNEEEEEEEEESEDE